MAQPETVRKVVVPLLREHGFRQVRADSWARHSPETIVVINSQHSNYSKKYYINVAVWLLPLGEPMQVREELFHLRLRMEALLPERRQEIEELFDFERTDIAEQDRDRRVWKLFNDKAIPMLLKWDTLTVVRAAYKNGVFKQGFVHRTARALLEARAE